MWGQVFPYSFVTPPCRIIPMRVGTRPFVKFFHFIFWDHPHACGDKSALTSIQVRTIGSSPCVWGQELCANCVCWCGRIIPMRVGTSFDFVSDPLCAEDHPHACGDKFLDTLITATSSGSSPCVWGQAIPRLSNAWTSRIIPMRVGTRVDF